MKTQKDELQPENSERHLEPNPEEDYWAKKNPINFSSPVDTMNATPNACSEVEGLY